MARYLESFSEEMAPAKEEVVSVYELAITAATLNGGARAGDNRGRSVSVLALDIYRNWSTCSRSLPRKDFQCSERSKR